MKLEEAASILGVSLEDITIDGLKQTYKKLALAWDPEKCKDQNSKSKYLQISEAYKKLNSVMEGTDGYKGDDSHEIAAFMRMFMDMVGISESDSIPAAMTFGMMFGANQNTVEEWSTDEDGEGDYDDDSGDDDEDDEDDEEDDDDEEEYLPDEYFEEYAHPNSHLGGAASAAGSIHAAMKGKLNIPVVMGASWEPQVKQYSNMNLKDQLNQERLQMQLDAEDASDNEENETGELTEQEKERKLKLAKKRAEKRKKQKEKDKKKSKEQNSTDETGEEGNPENSGDYAINIKDFLDDAELNPNDLKKLIRFHTDHIITELMHAVTNGQLSRVNQILSYDFNEDVPAAVASVISLLREQLPSAPVLHQCITNLSKVTSAASNGKNATAGEATSSSSSHPSSAAYNTAMFTALAARRLEVARFLLNFSQPAFDLSTVDSSGLSVLHSAIANGDLKIAQLIIKAIAQPLPLGNNTNERERKSGQLNINSRCHRQGWAPIHYAVERGDVEAVRLLAQHGANVQVTMATDKRQTPLELAKMKLKAANAANKANMQAVVEELQLAIERNKQNKEAENKAKRAELEKQQQQQVASAKNEPKKTDESKANASSSANAVSEVTAVGTSAPTPAKSSASTVPATPSTDKKAKKKKDKEKAPAGPAATATPAKSVASSVAPAVSEAPAPVATANTKGSKNPSTEGVVSAAAPVVPAAAPASATKGKKNKKEKSTAAAGAGTTAAAETLSINPIAEMSVSSRDEMVDRLLAMGFREADCLHAISLYGTDIDQAISWLCDRPAVAAPTPSKAPEEVTRPVDASPVASGHMTLAAAMAAGAAMTAPTTPGSAATLQKEKEELRRINRAWNAKAEDEKRRAEALRKQAELEKQQELLLQKQQQEVQRQQQAQQEYMYQQHLQQQQQYMALHQHQQHPHQLHSHGQPQAYFGGAHGHGWTPQQQQQQQHAAMYGASIDPASVHAQSYPTKASGNATSFPVGSLQHMATMLATPSGPSGNNPHAHPHAANKTGFGAHGASSSSAPPLQTLSGAMALAMEGAGVQPSLGGGLYGGLGGLSGAFPPSSGILGGANGSASGLLYKDSSSGLPGKANNASSASSSSWGVESLGGDLFSGNSLSNDAEHHEVIVDGALELSAGARPFVPRFGSAALGGSSIGGSASLAGGPTSARSNVSPLASPLLGPLSGSLIGGSLVGNTSASTGGSPLTSAFGAPLSASSLGGLNLSGGLGSGLSGGLTGSPWGSSASLSMDANNNANDQQSNISSYLSNLLSTDLNLDEDNYEYGDASNIIPNLDSFLLNDN